MCPGQARNSCQPSCINLSGVQGSQGYDTTPSCTCSLLSIAQELLRDDRAQIGWEIKTPMCFPRNNLDQDSGKAQNTRGSTRKHLDFPIPPGPCWVLGRLAFLPVLLLTPPCSRDPRVVPSVSRISAQQTGPISQTHDRVQGHILFLKGRLLFP